MTTKKITVKIAAGIGNQMFMYANAYTLSKKYSLNLTVDNTSGYFQKKIEPYQENMDWIYLI